MGELAGWTYCPRCGAELRGDPGRLDCAACAFVVYAASKPTASALCVDGTKLLLVRRAVEPYLGYWDLPGGFLQEGEHPIEGLRRELLEETGLEVEPEQFLGTWMDTYGGDSTAEATLNMYWTVRVVSGELRADDDISEARWFELDELPSEEEIAFENVPQVLAAWRARHEHA
ncbi:MAG: NUDIX hydrolase [Actinomycetota bacterium]|nr:NUDIX hydrolase [Actinomycetota bacterium]